MIVFLFIVGLSFLFGLLALSLWYWSTTLSKFTINHELVVILLLLIASVIAGLLISGINSSHNGVKELIEPMKGIKGKNKYLLLAFFLDIVISVAAELIL